MVLILALRSLSKNCLLDGGLTKISQFQMHRFVISKAFTIIIDKNKQCRVSADWSGSTLFAIYYIESAIRLGFPSSKVITMS